MAILSSGFITIKDFNDITSSPTAPTSPVIDQVWLDTSVEPPVLKTWNGSSWVETNGITIGGRNILRNTALLNSSFFTFVDGTTIDNGMKNGANNSIKYKIENSDSTIKIGATPTPQPVVFGESYSASAEVYLPATHGMKEYDMYALEIQCFNAIGGLITSYMVYGDKKTIGKWVKLKLENQIIPVGTVEATARVVVQGKATIWVSNLQLERGTKVSDWTPSPEDITEEIGNVKEKAEEAEKNALQGIEDAREANQQLSDMASDNVLTPVEKQQISRTWSEIKVEKPSINKQAQTYNVSTTNYDTVYNALSLYIDTLALNVETNTNISPITFSSKFNDYYTERQLILNKIAEESKKQAQDYTDSALDEVVIGGRNFLKYSDFSKDLVKSLISSRGNHTISIDTNTKYMDKNTLKIVSSGNGGNNNDVCWVSVLGSQQGSGAGRKLLFSFYAKAEKQTRIKARIAYGSYQLEAYVDVTTVWERHVIDISEVSNMNISGEVIFHLTTSSTVWMAMGQLEEGTKVTDWTKAIEDYDDDMLEILEKAEEAEENAQKGIQQATQAQNLLNDIASDSKLTSVEKQEVSRKWEEIKVEKDSIVKQASVYNVSTTSYVNAYNTLSVYVNGLSLSSSITTDINKNTFNSTFNAYYTQRQNILNSIATKTKEYANSIGEGIVIGGTNLLEDSTGNLGSFSVSNVVEGYMNNKAYRVRRTSTENSSRTQIQKTVLLPSVNIGDSYTLSAWIYIDPDVVLNQDNNQLYVRCYHTDGSNFVDICTNNIPSNSPVGKWFRVEATSTLSTSDINPERCMVSMAVADAGSIRFSMIKLERGTKASDWTPAISDLENAYSIILSNEAQVIPTFNDRYPMSSKTYTTQISVYQGKTARTDFSIGTINNANGITVSKSGSTISFSVSQSTVLTSDDGQFIVPIVIDGKTFNKVFSWACSKQGESGTNAEIITLSGEQVFKYTNNFTGEPTPTSIKIQAQVQGFDNPKYVWDFKRSGDTAWTTIASATNANQSYYELAHNNNTIFSGNLVKSVTIRCTVGNKYDELTIVKVSDGSQGVGISSVKEQYYHSTSQVELTGGTWQDYVPTTTSGKFVWTRSVIAYTNGQTTTTSPMCVTGKDGDNGVSVTSVDVEYAKSSSATTAPTSGWETTSPTWENGQYIWSRTVTSYSNGSQSFANPACITGQKGETGSQGIQGIKGEDGLSTYFHVRYSVNSNGNPMTEIPTANTEYMGVVTTTSQTAPSGYGSYTWSKIKGEDGERGVQGAQGSDGRTSYLHIKYSNDGKTFTSNNGETVGTYIGTYVDFTETDSNNFSDYTWKKYVGEDGTDGKDGIDGYDAYTVILTNETHTFQTENDGSITTAVSTTSDVIAYKGATSVTPTLGTITNPSGMTITKSGTKLTFQANTGNSLAENGTVTIPVVIDGKTFNKTFSWSKARKGQNAKSADILASSQVFKSTDGGITFAPDNIVLTPQLQNCSYSSWQYCTNYSTSGTPTWTNAISGQNGLTISNGVLTISKTSSLFTDSITSITFKLNTNASNVNDTITVSKLYDVKDLEMGTRNLLKETSISKTVTGNNTSNQCTNVYDFVNKSVHFAGLSGEEVTVGFAYKSSTGATGTLRMQTNGTYQSSLGETSGLWVSMSPTINVASKSEGYVTYTLTMPKDETKGFTGIQLRIDDFVGSVTISEMIIVKGNKLGDWSPAPEDIQSDITAAKNAAQSAQNTANSAKTEATNAITKLTEIASDSKLTSSEKQQVARDWEEIKLEKPSIINQANVYSIPTTEFVSAYSALETYIGTLALTSSSTTTIIPSDFNAKFNTYYIKRQAILDSIATKTKAHADSLVNTLKGQVDTAINGLQTQVDGKVETWAQSNDPSTAWTTTELKTAHTGDIWYNTSTKITYRYSGTEWVKLSDADAENAKNLATSKKRVFTSTPTVPYDVGDLWVTNMSGTGELKICKTARSSGSYTSSEWIKATDYVTSSQAGDIAQDKVNGQTQADIFNKLTNNGANQGIFLDGGKVWINGEYIKAGTIVADKIATNTITADKMAIGDFTNYAQLNDKTATKYGFSVGSSEADGSWLTRSTLSRDNYISDYYTCNGGESFRLKGDISTTVKGASTSGGTDSSYRGVAVGIVAYDGTGKALTYLYSSRATNETKTVSSTVTLPTTARKFRVFIQIEGWATFSGTLKVRNIQVVKMSNAELIVNGSITANHLQADVLSANNIVSIINGGSTTISGDKITTGSVTADKINIKGLVVTDTGGNTTFKIDANGGTTIGGKVETYGTNGRKAMEFAGTNIRFYSSEGGELPIGRIGTGALMNTDASDVVVIGHTSSSAMRLSYYDTVNGVSGYYPYMEFDKHDTLKKSMKAIRVFSDMTFGTGTSLGFGIDSSQKIFGNSRDGLWVSTSTNGGGSPNPFNVSVDGSSKMQFKANEAKQWQLWGGMQINNGGLNVNGYDMTPTWGTYSPALYGNDNITFTMSRREGRFCKVGKLVTIYARVVGTRNNSSGYLRMTLPYVVRGGYWGATICFTNGISAGSGQVLKAYAESGGNFINFSAHNITSGSGWRSIHCGNDIGSREVDIAITITYETD